MRRGARAASRWPVSAELGAPARAACVMVVHPGAQHSRELARALQDARLLQRFVTSIDERYAAFLPRPMREGLRARSTGLPRSRVATLARYELAARLLERSLPSSGRGRAREWALDRFGRAAGRRVTRERPRVVTAFEGNAEHVFGAARACGATTVLEAPSLHAAWQPAEEPADGRPRVEAAKARELMLADHVVVLSTFARDSYVAAGVPADHISIVPPGVWTDRVAHAEPPARDAVRLLFVGNIKRAKGVDLLIEAFARSGSRATLVLAGPIVEPGLLARLPEGVEVAGKLDPAGLRSQYARADLLVLPSRADGFGMVVGEAMRSGLAVIVSSATGAKDIVVPGRNGWIVASGDVSSLAAAIDEAISDAARLRQMGAAAREDAAGLTWERYAQRTAKLYTALVAGTRPAQVLE